MTMRQRSGVRMASNPGDGASISSWLAAPLDARAKRQIALMAALPGVQRLAVLPDAHAGSLLCNGVALATESAIYPDAVGRDIGCGYTAVRLVCEPEPLEHPRVLQTILERLCARVQTLRRRDRAEPGELPPAPTLSEPLLDAEWRRISRSQFATLGRGNHFIEIQRDAEGHHWIMVHTGSRSLGEAVHLRHTSRAGARIRGVARLEIGTAQGDAYLHDARCVQQWASANRVALLELAARAVAEIAGAAIESSSTIDSPHNTISVEHHNAEFIVHRKSAARARVGDRVLMAGSASTFSVHAVGLGCRASLESCAHGAGRALPRSVAARRFGAREVERQYERVVFDRRQVDRLRDEAPLAYRDLRSVLRAQHELARTTLRVFPLLSFKGV
jgi:tRNA-splicing ligase RtcB